MNLFLQGCIAMSFAVCGLFFLRYWRAARDRLLLFFAIAFFLLAFNRILLALFGAIEEDVVYLYVVRLIAYCIIIAAIIDKNLRPVLPAPS